MSGGSTTMQQRLCAGLLAFLPWFGAEQAATDAVREGNELYQAKRYEAALEKYAQAAERLPDEMVIRFDQGNVWFRLRDTDKAQELYMAALATEDEHLKSRAKYNLGVIALRQALGTEQSATEALARTQEAIRHFRESLELDRDQSDARYNLELAYRFRRHVSIQLRDDGTDLTPGEKASLRRGQALRDRLRNEGGGDRRARPEMNRETHGERGGQAPENFSSNEQQEQPKDARLPIAMGADAAAELMERLMQEMQATEQWRRQKQRAQLQAPGEREPW